MADQPRYFRIGLFVLTALAVLAASLIFFGAGRIFRERLYVETYVDGSVQGMDVGSAVKFRGVPIGRVSKVDFCFNIYGTSEEGSSDYVYILMEIDVEIFNDMFKEGIEPLLGAAIEQGLRVQLQPQGITGLSYLEINYFDPARFPVLQIWWKPLHPYIPSAPGQIASLLDSVNNIMAKVEEMDIRGTLAHLNEVLSTVNTAVNDLQVAKLSGDLQQLLRTLDTQVAQLDTKQLTTEGVSMLNNINNAATQLKDLTRQLEGRLSLNPDAVNDILGNLQILTENLRVLSENAKKYPAQLLLGDPPQRLNFEEPPSRRRP